MNILITGGTGYIGAHVCRELLEHKHRVAILIKNGKAIDPVITQIETLTGNRPWIFRGDIRQEEDIYRTLRVFKPEVVIHAAGIKVSDGSEEGYKRLMETNVNGTRLLANAVGQCGIGRFIHLSSSCVSGDFNNMTPYGRSKTIADASMQELTRHWDMSTVSLRIHNVGGAHSTGFLAEDEESSKHSFFTQLAQVAVGELPYVMAYRCLRDYVHVMDVASSIRKSLPLLFSEKGFISFDIGSGRGCQPMDVLEMFENVSGQHIEHRQITRPSNMSPTVVADTSFAEHFLGWRAQLDIERICRDTWFVHTTGLNRLTPVPFSRIASCRSNL